MKVWTEWYPPAVAGMEMLMGFHYFTRLIDRRAKVAHYLVYLSAMSLTAACLDKIGGDMLLFGVSLAAAGGLFYRVEKRIAFLYAAVITELLQICFGFFDSVSYLLFPLFYRQYPTVVGNCFMVMGSLLALLLFVLCSQAICRHFSHVQDNGRREGMLLPLLPMLLMILMSRYISVKIYGDTIYIQPDGSISGQPAFFLLVLQILGIAGLFCILYSDRIAAESFRLCMECSLMEQETRYMERYVEEARLRYEKTSAFRHDIRNHMWVVRGLLQQKNMDRHSLIWRSWRRIEHRQIFPVPRAILWWICWWEPSLVWLLTAEFKSPVP